MDVEFHKIINFLDSNKILNINESIPDCGRAK